MSKNKSQSTVTTTSTSLYISLICLFPVMFLISYLIFYMIDTMLLKLDVSFVDSFLNHKRDGAITGICMWALCFYYVAFGLKINRPQQSNVIATARWRTLKEQKKYFGEAPIDTTQHLDVGGASVESVLGRPIEKDDLPNLIKFLEDQENRGRWFSKAMNKDSQNYNSNNDEQD